MNTRLKLVIAETDSTYLKKLKDYIVNSGIHFDVISFTDGQALTPFLQSGEADILLIDEKIINAEVVARAARYKVRILFASQREIPVPDGWKRITKYQKTENLLREIRGFYAEKNTGTEIYSTGSKKTKLLTFYSPVGGSGKTTLALACAMRLLSQENCRVFYLNCEEISSVSAFLRAESAENMSDLIHVLNRETAVTYKIQSARIADTHTRLEYINPPDSGIEYSRMDKPAVVRLMRDLSICNEYDFIIIDLSSHFSDVNMAFLEKCDLIIMPMLSGMISQHKIAAFFEELRKRYRMFIPDDKIILTLNQKEVGTPLPSGLPVQAFTFVPVMDKMPEIQHLRRLRDAFGIFLDDFMEAVQSRL